MDDQGAEPAGGGMTRFSYCPSHIMIEDTMTDVKNDIRSLEQRFGDLVKEQTKTQAELGGLIKEMKADREDRAKDRELLAKNVLFLQGLVTCNNKASVAERKELIKYGGKVVLILLAAVVGLRIVTAVLGLPFP